MGISSKWGKPRTRWGTGHRGSKRGGSPRNATVGGVSGTAEEPLHWIVLDAVSGRGTGKSSSIERSRAPRAVQGRRRKGGRNDACTRTQGHRQSLRPRRILDRHRPQRLEPSDPNLAQRRHNLGAEGALSSADANTSGPSAIAQEPVPPPRRRPGTTSSSKASSSRPRPAED